MTQEQKLQVLITELKRLTGIRMTVDTNTPEEVDTAIEQLHRLCNAYKNRYDKTHFLKSILEGSFSVQEINDTASHFHLNPNEARIPYLLETKTCIDDTIMALLKQLFPAKLGVLLIPVAEKRVLVLVQCSEKNFHDSSSKTLAYQMIESLNAETFADGWVVCGPRMHHLSELADVYDKLSLAMKIRHTFYSEQSVLLYNRLGIGRLIQELPRHACESFLNEIFVNGIRELDSEIRSVTNCFFQNNLNIAETARQLHMHRNTLIYRLDQIEQMTGLNLKNFEDAMTFKIALMILNMNN